MANQALMSLLCWLAVGVQGVQKVNVTVKDNISAASAHNPLLGNSYRIYASGVPHGAFSFHRPVVASPAKAASHLVPVKEEHIVVKNQNGFLKDSYGNSFVETPQTLAYKTVMPRQFVKLQDLPLHLSKPLDAAASPVHILGNGAPYQYGSVARLPAVYQSAASGSSSYASPSFGLYSGNLKSLSLPQGRFPQGFGSFSTLPQQQSSNHKTVYAQKQPYTTSSNLKYSDEDKIKKFLDGAQPQASNTKQVDHKPEKVHKDKAKLKKATQYGGGQKKYTVQTGNGEKVSVTLNTKPPVPQILDLNLLEPLTFENPIVPQVQHFLPRINYKFPKIEEESHRDEFLVQKTKSYDTGIQVQPQDDDSEEGYESNDDEDDGNENEYNNSSEENEEPEPPPRKPVQHKKNARPQNPTRTFAINSPNYKETYTEQVVSYDDSKDTKPVHYSYDIKTDKKPVSYSYSHSSANPNTNKQAYTHSANPNEQKPTSFSYVKSQGLPAITYGTQQKTKISDILPQYQASVQTATFAPQTSNAQKQSDYHYISKANIQQQPSPSTPHPLQTSPPKSAQILSNQQLKPEQREVKYHYLPNGQLDNGQQKLTPFELVQDNYGELKFLPVNLPPKQGPAVPAPIQPITDYANNIKLVPKMNEQIIVQQHHQPQQQAQQRGEGPSSNVHLSEMSLGPQHPAPPPRAHPAAPAPSRSHHGDSAPQQQRPPHHHPQQHHNTHHSSGSPHVIEKSRKVIIQEETPEEMHMHREQMTAEVVNDGDSEENSNSEENFEKSYKDAAYGFPAYDRDEKDEGHKFGLASEIPSHHSDYDFKNSPFEQYVEDGDEFPKSARLSYKDDREGTKEDYYLDFSVKQPESFVDRNKNKQNYFKMFKTQKPEDYFGESSESEKQSEQYRDAPGYGYPQEPPQKSSNYFAQFRAAPKFEYDYTKQARDNAPYASGAVPKAKTLFVEPQFQYGFEPLSLPQLLDSELSAMASSLHPSSDKTGTRKKIYKENFYIKKTTTSGGKPAS